MHGNMQLQICIADLRPQVPLTLNYLMCETQCSFKELQRPEIVCVNIFSCKKNNSLTACILPCRTTLITCKVKIKHRIST